jgi:hypothetical protein
VNEPVPPEEAALASALALLAGFDEADELEVPAVLHPTSTRAEMMTDVAIHIRTCISDTS